MSEEYTYGDARLELVELIISGHFDYPESASLAIASFYDAWDQGETPKMCLAIAKTLNGEFIDYE